MKHLLTIHQSDVVPGAQALNPRDYAPRQAARAVLLDADGAVYLMNVSKFGYHKLPGGGIDPGENVEAALERELMEEVGCQAEILAELGEIVEWRDFIPQHQTSYCYLAQQIGQQQASALEEGELEEGMYEVKAPSLADAIALLEADKPTNLEGRFIKRRDLAFLRAAHLYMASQSA